MAQLLRTLSVAPRAVRELRVDTILLQAGVKKHRDSHEHIMTVTWQDLADREQCVFKTPWPTSECTEVVARAEYIEKDSLTIFRLLTSFAYEQRRGTYGRALVERPF